MGFSYEEVEAKRGAIPSPYRVGADSSLSSDATRRFEIKTAIADADDALGDEIAFIEANGEIAVAQGPLTEAERRNTEARLMGDAIAKENLAQIAGQSTRIDNTGLGAKAEAAKRAQAESRKADIEARNQMMLALQAQLDQLNIEIDALGDALDYLNRTGDVHGTMNKPYVQDAIAAWEKKHGTKFDPDHPEAKAHLSDAIGDHRKTKLETRAEVAETLERGRAIYEAAPEDKSNLVKASVAEGDTFALSTATRFAKSDEEKLEQYEIDGMSDRQKSRLLAESKAENIGGGFPSFARQMDDKPTFMAESNTENFNKQAAQGLERAASPQVVAAAEAVPDFMKNAG